MGCPIVNETARLSQAQQTAPFETIDSVDFLKNTALDIPTFIALLFFSNSLKLPGLLETSRNSGAPSTSRSRSKSDASSISFRAIRDVGNQRHT